MHRIIVDGVIPAQAAGNVVIDPELTEAINTAGALTYSLPYDDPYLSEYIEKVTRVQVEDNSGGILWGGRLLNATTNFYGTVKMTFEGDMAMLNDVVYPPYSYSGNVSEFFMNILNFYNARVEEKKKIKPGRVTVTAENNSFTRSSNDYETCWKVLTDKLVTLCGGYLVMRWEDDGRYLDYLTEPGSKCRQRIEFGVNLMDLERYIDAENVATVLIPLGAVPESTGEGETTEQRRIDITTASGNTSGKYYIESPFVKEYGWIEKVNIWEDVKVVNTLYAKALEYAETMAMASMTITVKAVDLHLTDSAIDSFEIGDTIECVSKPHGISVELMMTERVRKLNDPAQDTLTLGATQDTLTDNMSKQSASDKLQLADEIKAQANKTYTKSQMDVIYGGLSDLLGGDDTMTLKQRTMAAINAANAVTGAQDDNVTDAVNTLIEGYSN